MISVKLPLKVFYDDVNFTLKGIILIYNIFLFSPEPREIFLKEINKISKENFFSILDHMRI